MEEIKELTSLKPAQIPVLFRENFPKFLRGSQLALSGLRRNCKPDTPVSKIYWKFVQEAYIPILIPFYIAFITLAVFFFPLTIAALLFAPGVVWQLLTILPVWALSIAQKRHPVDHNKLFIEGLRPLDADLAKALEEGSTKKYQNTAPRSWAKVITESFSEHVWFWYKSGIISVISIIPFVGSIFTAALQTYLNCMKLNSRVLEIYVKDLEHMSKSQKETFFRQNRALLLGFAAPYIVFSSIPFVGPLALVYAEASAADLVYYELRKKVESTR